MTDKPPETSLSSRELVEQLFNSIPRPAFDPKLSKELKGYLDRDLVKNTAIQSFSALIDAWARVLEARVRFDEAKCWSRIRNSDGPIMKQRIQLLESALATARKQLEEKAP